MKNILYIPNQFSFPGILTRIIFFFNKAKNLSIARAMVKFFYAAKGKNKESKIRKAMRFGYIHLFLLLLTFSVKTKGQSLIEKGIYHAIQMDADTSLTLRLSHLDSFQNVIGRIALDNIGLLKEIGNLIFVESEDNNIQIISYSFRVHSGHYNYFMLFKSSDDSLRHISHANANVQPLDKYESYSLDHWYGSLYYKILQKKVKRRTYYFLLGYRDLDHTRNEKFIEVLSYSNDQWKMESSGFFDLPRFQEASRYSITYHEHAKVKLNFDLEKGIIIQDHLIPFSSPEGMSYLPDGSYIGLKWKKNKWIKVEKIYDQISKEAPLPKPILNGKKDIFGSNK